MLGWPKARLARRSEAKAGTRPEPRRSFEIKFNFSVGTLCFGQATLVRPGLRMRRMPSQIAFADVILINKTDLPAD
jgi:G3E family GTPase